MIAGILLAAGRSTRFGANKLVHPLPDGTPLALAALRNLRQGVDDVIVVVRPDDAELIRLIAREQAHVLACPEASRGMGASLACGIQASRAADGWLIALGDMPRIPPAVVAGLANRLRNGAAIVAPAFDGRRGHPVGFSCEFLEALCRLEGDAGARTILETNAAKVELITTHEPGVLRDIDTPADLLAAPPNGTGNRV